MTPEEELFNLCKKFIAQERIHSPETIYQTDSVIEHAYEFIEGVCNIVGYYKYEDFE